MKLSEIIALLEDAGEVAGEIPDPVSLRRKADMIEDLERQLRASDPDRGPTRVVGDGFSQSPAGACHDAVKMLRRCADALETQERIGRKVGEVLDL